MIREQVGQRIRKLRLEHGLSQEAFAMGVELDRTYIASVERGHRNISIVNLAKIWNYFNISPKEFFDDALFARNV